MNAERVHVEAPVLTIDGPSAVGKGTISRAVASALHWHLLDSGALYRLTALAAMRAGLDWSREIEVAGIAQQMAVRFAATPSNAEQVWLEGREVTEDIRTEQAANGASRVAALPAVRQALLGRQRAFALPPGLVADGRDMGTVIFPRATVKIFLTASAEERARRRHKQLKDKGVSASLARLSQEIAERDARDMQRAVAPLKPSADAIVVDSSNLSIDTVTERILQLVYERVRRPT